MSKQIQRRRGSAADHATFTGAQGELTYNTDTKRVHAHDGLTAGGFAAARVDELAATGGSALVGYDGSTVQAVLDNSKPIADYAALRAYTGRAAQVRITSVGIAGFFYYDAADTTSLDNGGTIIVSGNGKRWKRIYEGAIILKWFGASGSSLGNDTDALSRALLSIKATGGTIRATAGTYMIDPIDLREYVNITLEGDNPSTDWPYVPTSVFKLRTAGDVGFKLADVTTTSIPAQSARGITIKKSVHTR